MRRQMFDEFNRIYEEKSSKTYVDWENDVIKEVKKYKYKQLESELKKYEIELGILEKRSSNKLNQLFNMILPIWICLMTISLSNADSSSFHFGISILLAVIYFSVCAFIDMKYDEYKAKRKVYYEQIIEILQKEIENRKQY